MGGRCLRDAIALAGFAVSNDIVIEGYAAKDLTGVSVSGFEEHNHAVALAVLELVIPRLV